MSTALAVWAVISGGTGIIVATLLSGPPGGLETIAARAGTVACAVFVLPAVLAFAAVGFLITFSVEVYRGWSSSR